MLKGKKVLSYTIASTLIAGTIFGINQAGAKEDKEKAKIENVIFLIGDGMGPTFMTAHRNMMDNPNTKEIEKTAFDANLAGTQTTHPEDEHQQRLCLVELKRITQRSQ
jgi:alkaline phosphatase